MYSLSRSIYTRANNKRSTNNFSLRNLFAREIRFPVESVNQRKADNDYVYP